MYKIPFIFFIFSMETVQHFKDRRDQKKLHEKNNLNISKREPAAEGGRSIGLIGYLSVYKTFLFDGSES